METKHSLMYIWYFDHSIILSIIFPVIAWAIYIIATVINLPPKEFLTQHVITFNDYPILFTTAVVLTVIGVFVLIWRISILKRMFKQNKEVIAKITKIKLGKKKGFIQYVFSYRKRKYDVIRTIPTNKATTQFHKNKKITVLIDRSNPERNIIIDVFGFTLH